MTDHQKLTLVCPKDMAEQLIEFLLEVEPAVSGFTTFAADGHGEDFATASVTERVRGRMARRVVQAIMPAGDIQPLLAAIRDRFTSPHMVYWTEPVSDFGDFA